MRRVIAVFIEPMVSHRSSTEPRLSLGRPDEVTVEQNGGLLQGDSQFIGINAKPDLGYGHGQRDNPKTGLQ
jgi:hypothetical protein